jgi:hypothetical protein
MTYACDLFLFNNNVVLGDPWQKNLSLLRVYIFENTLPPLGEISASVILEKKYEKAKEKKRKYKGKNRKDRRKGGIEVQKRSNKCKKWQNKA